jgi:hypothetical protein
MKLDELVAMYIELRDTKASLKNDYEGKVKMVDEKLNKIEAKLLEVFDQLGTESVKTGHGTAYKTTRSFASVADRDTFMQFVKDGDHWSMMEIRAAKTAVEQYKAANDELPPGINWREEVVVNIRRT